MGACHSSPDVNEDPDEFPLVPASIKSKYKIVSAIDPGFFGQQMKGAWTGLSEDGQKVLSNTQQALESVV